MARMPSLRPTGGSAEDQLPSVEAFRVAFRGIRFHASEPQDRLEGLLREPAVVRLARKAAHEVVDLAAAERPIEMDEHVRGAQIAVELGDLVLEDEMVPEGFQVSSDTSRWSWWRSAR